MTKLLVFLLLAAGLPALASTAYRSVWIAPVGPADIHLLQSEGYDIEYYMDSRARLYVTSDQEHSLESMGYMPVPATDPEPLVPYPTLAVMYDTLDAIVARHPDICRLVQVGTSEQGREILAVVVSDNVEVEEVEPELRLIASIHGDEKTGGMVALNYLRNLCDFSETSSMCSYVVDTAETWVIPVMNPDGWVLNQRYNASGIDLNRNLSYQWQPGVGGGTSPFSEPETVALRDITMKEWPAQTGLENPFCSSASLHGGAACFNYVWNYSSAAVPDTLLIVDMGARYLDLCTVAGFWVTEGWAWYVITGDVNDWSYGEYGGIDQTIEVHNDKQASDWPGVASAHYMALLDYFMRSCHGIWGTVTTPDGTPLDALIQVSFADGTDSQPLRFCRTDVTKGDYAKPALPGVYDVTASVPGYPSQTVQGVTVGPEQRVEVSFVFGGQGVEGEEPSPIPSMSAFPNPFHGQVEFAFPEGVEGTLTIRDITGRVVFSTPAGGASTSLVWNAGGSDGSVLPSGVYIATMANPSGTASRMLVLQR
jgi:hypothetical protein